MLTIRRATASGVEEIARDSVPDLLKRGDSHLWFHLDTPKLHFLQRELKIHDLTLEDTVNQNQRPKIESFENYVYMAIHPLVRKDGWEIERSELDLLLGRQWLVSVHYGPLPGLIENSHLHERIGDALSRGAHFLLYTPLDLIVDSYFPLLDQVEEAIDTLEDRLLAQPKPHDMNQLLALKRTLVQLRHAVTPQREVLNELTRHNFPFIRPEHSVYFRDVYDHLIRITEELDTLREILSAALQIYLASMSNQLNITMKRLTAGGTIFVVITAIAGIYGMNFKHMPELEWRYGYLAIMLLMALISLGLYLYFKKQEYL